MTGPTAPDRAPLLIWGASGHAKVVADAAAQMGTFRVTGFIDDVAPERSGSLFAGLTILGGAERLAQARTNGVRHIAIAIGDNATRLRIGDRARQAGFVLATIVHPKAVVAQNVSLGDGVFVAAGAILNPDVTCEELVIVNTGATVDHDCRLARGVHVSPGAHLAGRVTVGARTWIGIGAAVRDGVSIGADSVVGAGGVVIRDLPGGITAYGVPAVQQRPRSEERR